MSDDSLTRRSFLTTLSALAVAGVAGCTFGGRVPLAVAAPLSRDGDPRNSHLPAAFGGPAYTQAPPYTLTTSTELSEDYFLVQNHRIDPTKDKVFAYTRTSGQVEAMVLQDGIVKQVYRDPAQPGGWSVYALPDAEGVSDMVAGATGLTRKAPYLTVCYIKANQPDQLVIATAPITPLTGSEPSFTTSTVPWNSRALGLRISIVCIDALYRFDDTLVWAVVPSSTAFAPDAQVCWQVGSRDGGVLQGFDYSQWENGKPCLTIAAAGPVNSTTPNFLLYLPQVDATLEIWTKSYTDSGPMERLDKLRPAIQPPQPPQAGLIVTTVEYATQQQPRDMPTALVWTRESVGGQLEGNPQLWVLTYDGNGSRQWVWTNLGLPEHLPTNLPLPVTTGITPRSDKVVGYLLDVFVRWSDRLSVSRQIQQWNPKDSSAPAFTPMIPLQGDVATMTSQAGATAGNQLILVAGDGTLHTLEKDAAGGWNDATVQLPAAELQQGSSYRVTLTLADAAWNAPVTAHDLTITASGTAVAMIEGPAPRTVQLGSTPVTVTTDTTGEVTVALLADGLSAPTLTVTSAGLPKPVTVYPSEPINTYMRGGNTLNYLPAMTADTLTSATTPDGQKVAPGAAEDPSETTRQVSTMKQAAELGAQGTVGGAISSIRGRVDGRNPHHARHGRPHHDTRHGHPGAGLSTAALGTNIDNWGHDVFHAIKKGATSVKTVTIDAEHKIVSIAVDATGWVENTVEIVVNTIEDAAHVLHSALNRLAADILHAVKWLEAEVIGVLRSAKILSDKFEQWIGSFSVFAATALASESTTVARWLTKEQQWVTSEMTTLTGRFSGKTTLSTMAANPPRQVVIGRRPAPGKPRATGRLGAPGDDQQPVHGDWFYRKIKHELLGSGLKIDLSNLPDLKAKLTSFSEKSVANSVGFQNRFVADFWKGFIDGAVKSPDDVDDILIQPLLQALLAVVNDAFDYAESIVADAFALLHDIAANIPKLLGGTTLKNLPILGSLMRLVGLGDVSIGRVANLIFAFPAALVYKIAHGASAQPFTSTGRPHAGSVGDVAGDLQICAASVMGTWAVFDTVSAAFAASGDDGGILFNAIDIAAPLIVTILTTPATKDGEPFFAPPVSGNPADILGFVAWILGAVPAFSTAEALIIAKSYSGNEAGAKEMIQMSLWFQTLTGVLALVFGMVANSQKDTPKGADYAGATLNNMPTIAAAGLTDVVIEATVGISVVVTMALTLICGELGALVYGTEG